MIPEDDIEGLLKKAPQYTVSDDLNAKILKAIDNRRLELEHEAGQRAPGNFWERIARFFPRFHPAMAAAFVFVLVLGGLFYKVQPAPAPVEVATQSPTVPGADTVQSHLDNARAALTELKNLIASSPAPVSWVPAAMAEEPLDEIAVAALTTRVVGETESAMSLAESIDDPDDAETALTQISDVQAETADVFSDVADVVQTPSLVDTLVSAIETTAAHQEAVESTHEEVRAARTKGEKHHVFQIASLHGPRVAALKTHDAAAVQGKILEAKASLETLKTSNASPDEIIRAERKITRAEKALADGKTGQAFGLSTSVHANARRMERLARKEKEHAAEVGQPAVVTAPVAVTAVPEPANTAVGAVPAAGEAVPTLAAPVATGETAPAARRAPEHEKKIPRHLRDAQP